MTKKLTDHERAVLEALLNGREHEVNAEVARLTTERNEARTHARFAESEHGKADAECETLKAEVARLTEALAVAEQDINHHARARNRAFERAETAEARGRELDQALSASLELTSVAESELTQLREKMSTADADIRTLTRHREERNARIDELEKLVEQRSEEAENELKRAEAAERSKKAAWAIAKTRLEMNEKLCEEIRQTRRHPELEKAIEDLKRDNLQWRQLCDKYRQIHYDATGEVI
jgi:chromosome segregation ATPase